MTVIVDAKGRKLDVVEPNAIERMKLMRAVGKAADIDRYFGLVMLSACVRSIDDVPCPFPTSANEAEGLVGRVGDDGQVAVAEWMVAQREADLDVNAAKN
jgi:hypothetical protein